MALRVYVPRRVLIPSGTKDPGTFLCDEGSQDDLHAAPPGTILGSGPLGTLTDAALSTPFRLGYVKTISVKPSEEALHPGSAGDPPPRAVPAAAAFKHQLSRRRQHLPTHWMRSRRPARDSGVQHRRIQAATTLFTFGCALAVDCSNSSHHLRERGTASAQQVCVSIWAARRSDPCAVCCHLAVYKMADSIESLLPHDHHHQHRTTTSNNTTPTPTAATAQQQQRQGEHRAATVYAHRHTSTPRVRFRVVLNTRGLPPDHPARNLGAPQIFNALKDPIFRSEMVTPLSVEKLRSGDIGINFANQLEVEQVL
ncbi:hypothetical protein A4X06_0g9770, partial [Tilletia controversa]